MKPRKRPNQERSRKTVETILEAAAQVFESRGYAGATTDSIAERAGVSIGSVYQYFPNKDAILVALVERHVDEGSGLLRRMIERASGESLSLEVLICRFVDAMMTLHRSEPKLHRVFFEEAPLPGGVRGRVERYEDEFSASVASLFEGLQIENPDVAARIVVRSIEGLIHGFVLHPPPNIEPDEFCREVVKLLVRYLE